MIRVGPAGWSYPDWEGVVYPRKKPRGFHPLEYLTSFVDCVEIDSSFYRPSEPAHAERWAEIARAKEGFRLLAKLYRGFTHEPVGSEEEWRAAAEVFARGVEPLVTAGVFSALLVQFPVSFTRTSEAERRLERIAALFDALPLVVELRHRAWFAPDALALLRRLRLSLIHIDLPAARDHPPPWHAPTGPIGYLRLHGRNSANWFAQDAGRDRRYDYLYSPAELEELADRARRLAEEYDEVYVVMNNHFDGQGVVNAIELAGLLSGAPAPAPPELVERYPRLAACTRTLGQTRLF